MDIGHSRAKGPEAPRQNVDAYMNTITLSLCYVLVGPQAVIAVKAAEHWRVVDLITFL